MRKRSRAVLLSIGSLGLLSCLAASANAQVLRKKDAPVEAPRTSDPPATTNKVPTGRVTQTPGEDEGIIIVGGKGNKIIRAGWPTRNVVGVRIRYKTEYGYQANSNETGPTSCHAFSIVAAPYNSVRQEKPYPVLTSPEMTERDGYYTCVFLVTELPLNVSIQVNASVAGERGEDFATEAWQGGSQPQPPAGWRRVMTSSKSTFVLLTEEKAAATLGFEMVYSRR